MPSAPQQKKKEKPVKQTGSKELEKLVRRLEREIDAQEQTLSRLDADLELAATDYQEYLRLSEEREQAQTKLDELMAQWEEAAQLLE